MNVLTEIRTRSWKRRMIFTKSLTRTWDKKLELLKVLNKEEIIRTLKRRNRLILIFDLLLISFLIIVAIFFLRPRYTSLGIINTWIKGQVRYTQHFIK